MVSKNALIFVTMTIAAATAVTAQVGAGQDDKNIVGAPRADDAVIASANPWIPPWITSANPWIPPWIASANPWIPPWIASTNPWIPPWKASASWKPHWIKGYPAWHSLASFGPSCNDCTTRLVFTKFGGLVKACTNPALPYCNLGQCTANPSVACVPDQPSLVESPVATTPAAEAAAEEVKATELK